jgi:hypothetical protein
MKLEATNACAGMLKPHVERSGTRDIISLSTILHQKTSNSTNFNAQNTCTMVYLLSTRTSHAIVFFVYFDGLLVVNVNVDMSSQLTIDVHAQSISSAWRINIRNKCEVGVHPSHSCFQKRDVLPSNTPMPGTIPFLVESTLRAGLDLFPSARVRRSLSDQ